MTTSKEDVIKTLILQGIRLKHEDDGRAFVNTAESPRCLTSTYLKEINWDLFWEKIADQQSKTSDPAYQKTLSLHDVVIQCVAEYRHSDWFYETGKKARDDALAKEKAERENVPDITLKYEALLKENHMMKIKLHYLNAGVKMMRDEACELQMKLLEKATKPPAWVQHSLKNICDYSHCNHHFKNDRDISYPFPSLHIGFALSTA